MMKAKEPLFEYISSDISHKIVNGDSLSVLKKLENGKFDLIITSPPYNIGKSYETKTSIEKYLGTQEEIINELVRTLSDKGNLCWQVGNYVHKGEVFPLDIYYYQIFKKLGMKLRNRIIWHFGHGLHASNRFSGRYETILWFSVLLGLLTIVPVIGIITFELFIPTLRVSWWVIIFAISWMSTGAWSAIASLCMHAEYTLKDVLMVQVLPQVPPEGDRNINHERIRRAFSDTSNQQRLTKRWRNQFIENLYT